jgi:hypothetical protein
MSNYTKTTNFLAKDSLPESDSGKIIKGSEFDVEFNALQSVINTKADIASPTFSGTPAAPTPSTGNNSTLLATTAFVQNSISAISSGVTSISAGTTGLTPSTATSGVVTLAGTLNVANGGTGAATLAANNVLLGNGTSALQAIAPSTTGNVLTSNGTTWSSTAPTSPAKLSTASGSAPSYSIRAWASFQGGGTGGASTGTINGSGNVSSITVNSVGYYSVNFTTALASANYALAGVVRSAESAALTDYGTLHIDRTSGNGVGTTNCDIVVTSSDTGARFNPSLVTVMFII